MCNFPTAAVVLIKTVPLELVGEIKVFIFLHNSTCLQSRDAGVAPYDTGMSRVVHWICKRLRLF